jgi:hypothetical protein
MALRSFREPRLHQVDERPSIRSQVAMTYGTILGRGGLLPIIVTMVLTSVTLQGLLEFGPLWMVAIAAPALLYGPHWAGLTSAFGLGAALAGRAHLTRPITRFSFVGLMLIFSITLTASRSVPVVIVAQVGLAVLIVAASTFLTRRLHDCIPSTIRAGVSSGVGTLTWLAFLPFALTFGAVSNSAGVHSAGWMLVAITAITAAAMLKVTSAHATDERPCEATRRATSEDLAALAPAGSAC